MSGENVDGGASSDRTRRSLLGSVGGNQFRPDADQSTTRRSLLRGLGRLGASLMASDTAAAAGDDILDDGGAGARPVQMADPAFPDGAVTITLDPVVGTCQDFWRVFETEGVDGGSDGAIGVTSPRVFVNGTRAGNFQIGSDHYDVSAEPSADQPNYLVASNFDVEYSIENKIKLLDWRPCERPSDACLNAWRDMFRQTLWHERQHVRFFRAAVERANQTWANKTVRVNVFGMGDREAERKLRKQVDQALANTIYREILPPDGSGSRHDALHDQQQPIERFCDQCKPCRARGDAVEGVQTYHLQTDYKFSGRVPMQEGVWATDQTARGSFRLQRRHPESIVDTVASALGGLSEGLAGLTGSHDTVVRDNGPALIWSGIGDIQGTWDTRMEGGGQTLRNRQQISSTYEATGNSYPAQLRIDRRNNTWRISWPPTIDQGDELTRGPIGLLPAHFATGMSAQIEGDYDPTSDPFDIPEQSTYPVPDCGVSLTETIQRELEGFGPYRNAMGNYAESVLPMTDSGPDGTAEESLQISLTPVAMRECDTPDPYVEIPETLSDPMPVSE